MPTDQSALKEIKYSLEGLLLKLKLQYFGRLMQIASSLEKTLILGKTEGKRRRGWQRMRWLASITGSVDMNLRRHWETGEDRRAWWAAVHGATKNWTSLAADPQQTWPWIHLSLQPLLQTRLYSNSFSTVESSWKFLQLGSGKRGQFPCG